jgi:hypothetical protein
VVRPEKDDAFAELYYEGGQVERKEFYYGAGYLSQSSRMAVVPAEVISMKITKYSGQVRELVFDDPRH